MNFAPTFEKLNLSPKQKYLIKPFFTNLDKNTFAVSFLPPEVIGALCSRTSRAKEDLRIVLLKEFIEPFIKEKTRYGKSLKRLITFLFSKRKLSSAKSENITSRLLEFSKLITSHVYALHPYLFVKILSENY